jgi:hypothetical protein
VYNLTRKTYLQFCVHRCRCMAHTLKQQNSNTVVATITSQIKKPVVNSWKFHWTNSIPKFHLKKKVRFLNITIICTSFFQSIEILQKLQFQYKILGSRKYNTVHLSWVITVWIHAIWNMTLHHWMTGYQHFKCPAALEEQQTTNPATQCHFQKHLNL